MSQTFTFSLQRPGFATSVNLKSEWTDARSFYVDSRFWFTPNTAASSLVSETEKRGGSSGLVEKPQPLNDTFVSETKVSNGNDISGGEINSTTHVTTAFGFFSTA